jgi:hypothetical protein
MKVTNLERTCIGCPSQWQGHLEDGRMFYGRYRWGHLTVRLSKSPTKHLDDVFYKGEIIHQEKIGDEFDGSMDDEQFKNIMSKKDFTF